MICPREYGNFERKENHTYYKFIKGEETLYIYVSEITAVQFMYNPTQYICNPVQ